jgi:hypothetical protein
VELVSAARDGWTKLRWTVFKRDGGCVATSRLWFRDDTAPDQCRNKAGWLIKWDDIFQMEPDHVTDWGGIRRDDEAHLITVCPWHHRGSQWRIDTKERRQREREVLSGLYPEAWAR